MEGSAATFGLTALTTPSAGETRRTVRGPEWRRKQTLFSFTATPTAGTDARSTFPISRPKNRRSPPGPRPHLRRAGRPTGAWGGSSIRLEVKSADVLHPLDDATNLAVEGAFLEWQVLQRPSEEDIRSTGIIFEGNALQNVTVFVSRKGHLVSFISAPLFLSWFVSSDRLLGTFTRALPAVSPRRPPSERCMRFPITRYPSFHLLSAGPLPAPTSIASAMPGPDPGSQTAA